ncbi:hypothetical protein ENSA5_36490 [Enhygromyxa salina]|uniref:Coenzyme Q-binding protein COQ10 START domain-containing protein n=1 Tax=Enhygromyxa salina TaxID=215803 RepID=A0A2S9XUQ2_9BACT|nr:SRPBCC family protein [Enhygromyxa salina]PRP96573.1 hypothetical protein ENSA5_36490 [Enhygromyxa salina]
MHRFERSLTVPLARAELFAWHARPGAFERLAPTWERMSIVARRGTIEDGDRLHFRVHQGPLHVNWVARHCEFEAGRQFVDVAERSPFASWRHVHRFDDAPGGGSTLRDQVELRLPLHRLSWPLAGAAVEAMLERMFRQRHLRTAIDLRRHARVRGRAPKSLRITGTRGLLAEQLAAFWTTGGNELREAGGAEATVHIGGASEALARACEARSATLPAVIVIVASSTREAAAALTQVRGAGRRVVTLQTGVVVSARHPLVRGARRRLEQHVASSGFIDLDDLVGLIHRAVFDETFEGPHDAVAAADRGERGVELDFPTLGQSLAHQLGRLDERALARALEAFAALD